MVRPGRAFGPMCQNMNHESLKAYLAPTGLVSEPRGDLTCRGDLRLEVLISVTAIAIHSAAVIYFTIEHFPRAMLNSLRFVTLGL
jgi:hypothetical protein